MLHAALTRSPHAHAAVLGIDAGAARAVPGVLDVITAADLPGQLCQGPVRADRPVLAAGLVRHRGEPVAAVLAASAAAALEAASQVQVDYRELAEVHWFDAERCDPLHPDGNVLRTVNVRRGEMPTNAAVVVEGSYNTNGWVPNPEPFGVDGRPATPVVISAAPTDSGVVIRAPRRWHPADRDQLARCLDLMPHQIVLETSTDEIDHSADLGGAVVAAVLARRHSAGVALHIDPPSLGLGGGPMIALRYRHHAAADGTLLGVSAEVELDAGAYAGIAETLVAHICSIGAGPYRVPAVEFRVTALRSTTPPPMIEPGAVTAAVTFAVEAQLDRLAREVKLDPRVLRERALLALDDALPTGQLPLEESPVRGLFAALDSLPLPRMRDLGADGAWGAGTACGMTPFGIGEGGDLPVQASVRFFAGTATLTCAAAEGDEHLEAAAVAAVQRALRVPVIFEPTGEPLPGGGATSVGLAVQGAIDSLTASARETLGWKTGMSPSLLSAVDGRLRSFDGVIDVPLSEFLSGKGEGSGWYSPGRSEPLDPDGQGDAFPGHAYAAARAVLRMSSAGAVEIVRLDVAADCGRVLDADRARATVETSVRTGIRLALPEAVLAPDALSIRLVEGPVPKGAAGVAAGAVAAALRAAADAGAGGDAEVLPLPGVSWSSSPVVTVEEPVELDPAAIPGIAAFLTERHESR